MGMRCFVCGKKLNIFSDYTQIVVDGEKKEICTPCNRLREKKEVKQLLKTEKGREEVIRRSAILVSTGFLEICFAIFLLYFYPSLLISVILIGFGIYSIYKGVSYKYKANKKEQFSNQHEDEGIEFTSDELIKIKKGHKRLSRLYLIIISIWIIIILIGIILIFH